MPNEFTLLEELNQDIWAPEDMTDYNGHGTSVASVAGGATHGVASRANLVLVKFKQVARNADNPDSDRWHYRKSTLAAIQWAWDWVIVDVLERQSNGDTGKFIVNLSYGM